MYKIVLPLLSRKEKEKLVIELANEGKTTREIAKEVHMSLKDIGKIIHKGTGDFEELDKAEKEKEKQLQQVKVTTAAMAAVVVTLAVVPQQRLPHQKGLQQQLILPAQLLLRKYPINKQQPVLMAQRLMRTANVPLQLQNSKIHLLHLQLLHNKM